MSFGDGTSSRQSAEPITRSYRFEKMHPAPAWATEARRKVLKKRSKAASSGRAGAEDEDSDEEMSGDEDEVDDLFRGAGGTKKTSRRGLLQPGEIEIDRVRDANQAEATSVSAFRSFLRCWRYSDSFLVLTERCRLSRLPPSCPSPLLRHRRPSPSPLPGALLASPSPRLSADHPSLPRSTVPRTL